MKRKVAIKLSTDNMTWITIQIWVDCMQYKSIYLNSWTISWHWLNCQTKWRYTNTIVSDNILARGMITFPLTITGLPKSQGTDYIFVVNDTFSKDAHSSHCVILLLQKLLLKQLLCIMEFILSIVSDQDPFFFNHFWTIIPLNGCFIWALLTNPNLMVR